MVRKIFVSAFWIYNKNNFSEIARKFDSYSQLVFCIKSSWNAKMKFRSAYESQFLWTAMDNSIVRRFQNTQVCWTSSSALKLWICVKVKFSSVKIIHWDIACNPADYSNLMPCKGVSIFKNSTPGWLFSNPRNTEPLSFVLSPFQNYPFPCKRKNFCMKKQLASFEQFSSGIESFGAWRSVFRNVKWFGRHRHKMKWSGMHKCKFLPLIIPNTNKETIL